jgi:hypothetical protein
MAQNRRPPAYQEYASEMLAHIDFRAMSMEARGLLYTMRLECWANRKLPIDIEILSEILGKPVTPALLEAVRNFFKFSDNEINCPELDDYRNHLEDRKKKQSAGGKIGAKATNKKRRSGKNSNSASNSTGNSQVPWQGSGESLVQSSSEKQSQNQLIERDFSYLNEDGTDPLLDDLPTVCLKCSGEGCDWC